METKKCPYCGEEILAVAQKCKFCGEWLDEESTAEQIECPTCAERIDAHATVCPFCHEPVTPGSNSAGQSRPKPSAQTKSNGAMTSEPAHTAVTASPHLSISRAGGGDDAPQEGFFITYFWNVVIQHYADFKGSMSRKAYWMYVSLYMISAALIPAGLMLCNDTLGLLAYAVLCLGLLLPTLSAAIRRLHDIGKSGWMLLVALIPLVGTIWLLILLCKKGGNESSRAKWQQSDTIHLGAVAAIWALGIILSTVGGEKYYVYESTEWIPNSDFSWFYAKASDNKKDIEPKDYIESYGAQLIVAAEEPYGEVRKIISSKDIAARKHGIVEQEVHYELFPSTIDPDLLYFNYFMTGIDYPTSCGKVDCQTGEFELFDGAIVGMLSDGEYDGCYLRVNFGGSANGVNIYRQSHVGESADPLGTYDFSQFGGRNEKFLQDEDAAAALIEMFESAEEDDDEYYY